MHDNTSFAGIVKGVSATERLPASIIVRKIQGVKIGLFHLLARERKKNFLKKIKKGLKFLL